MRLSFFRHKSRLEPSLNLGILAAPMIRFAQLQRYILAGLSLLVTASLRAATTEILPPGFAPIPPRVHALVGAQVVIRPGETISNATVIIRDGFIQTVATNAAVPPDARVWDLKGLTIYAGFIDPYLTLGGKDDDDKSKSDELELTGGGIKFFGVSKQETDATAITGPGYEVAMVTPERCAAQTFSPDPKALADLRALGFTSANIVPDKGIIRGTSAFVALSDVEPNRAIIKPDVFQHVAFDTQHAKSDVYPASLMGTVAVVRQTFFDAQHYALDQADYLKHPAGRDRPAYNLGLEALAPTIERKIPVVFEPQDALMEDRAARVARELDLNFYLVSSGQEWRRPDLAKATGAAFIVPLNYPVIQKLPDDDDWEQVTLDELRAWDWAPENPAVLQNQGLTLALTTFGLDDKKDFHKNLLLAIDRGLTESNAIAALTTVPAKLCGVDNLLGTIEPGKRANLTIVSGTNYFDTDAKIQSVWIDGRFYALPSDDKDKDKEKSKDGSGKKSKEKADDKKIAAEKKKSSKSDDDEKTEKETKLAERKALEKRAARPPLEGRGVLASPPAVLIRNATIWTCGPQGVLTNAQLLVSDGKIQMVGNFEAKLGSNTLVIDGTGLSITPGIIDCHSHSMILGDVNEATLPSSAMVRIGDVVNSESENIYEQLAGGVTVAHLLHGSANPIGGQNCPIKLRDGESPEGLKITGAPGSIKFALGENVKQSNWGEKYVTRFPQTRMGVRTFYANRFTAAQQYLKAWEDLKKTGGVPPRRDLELEAIGEIISGTRLIHCHSYRQDEIIMLMRLMESFGVKIGTFQHVLEGYKVADEIAKHGAGGSTFSDWWAYKFEVYDAIPYNGSLMHDRGVNVSFNSDSSELARHLNLEAAKAVKFGGTPEIEALKFITLNPAQ
jgi:imidazolonepropionase-like amidohydrolase